MKVGAIVELIYINILGGRLGLEPKVNRIDIKEYLPAAINSALRKQYFDDLTIRQMEKIGALLPDQFIATYENVEIKNNTNRALKYIDLPANPISLMESMGLKTVSPMQGDIEFIYMKNRNQIKGYEEYVGASTFYWSEGKQIFFKFLSPLVTKVLVMMISSIENLKDDDEAPIPIGLEEAVMQNAYNWFTRQIQAPQDTVVDFTKDTKG